MSNKKQISASLEHPVIMYGYLKTHSKAEHAQAVRLWQRCFTASLDGEADAQFCYDKVVMLMNVNVYAFSDPTFFASSQVDDLPIFHAGVTFMRGDYPTEIFLFEEVDDMMKMLDEYPFNNFQLKNGERYADAAKKKGIKFGVHDDKEEAKYPPHDQQTTVRYEGCWDGQLHDTTEVADALTSRANSAVLSLPGWPSEVLQNQFLSASAQIREREMAKLPESLQQFYELLYHDQPSITPIVYKISLPGIEYTIHHIAVSILGMAEHDRIILLVQNNLLCQNQIKGKYGV